jgi:hypothetical protein
LSASFFFTQSLLLEFLLDQDALLDPAISDGRCEPKEVLMLPDELDLPAFESSLLDG